MATRPDLYAVGQPHIRPAPTRPAAADGLFARVAQLEAAQAESARVIAHLTETVARLSQLVCGTAPMVVPPAAETDAVTAGMRAIAERYARANGLTLQDMQGPGRGLPLSHVRQDCMLTMRDNGYSLTRIARFLGRDTSTVVKGQRAAARRREQAGVRHGA